MRSTISHIDDEAQDLRDFAPEIEQFLNISNKQINLLTSWNEQFQKWIQSIDFVKFNRNWLQTFKKADHIYFTGIGKNQPIAEKTANMLRSIGFTAHYFDITNALHGDIGVLRHNDVLVGISKSGKTAELVQAFRYIKANNICKTLTVSLEQGSSIPSTNHLTLPAVTELDDFNKIPTTSNLAFQMFFDVLAMFLSPQLTLKQFLKNHPGGEIGKTVVGKTTIS